MTDMDHGQVARNMAIRTQLRDTAIIACRWVTEDAEKLAEELEKIPTEEEGGPVRGLVQLSDGALEALDRIRVDVDLLHTAIG